MLDLLNSNPVVFVLASIALVLAITVHEFAHAWMAVRLGDPTPKFQKRLTLSPLAHLDPLGTLLLFVVGFGWGKPVQFDPFNLERPRRDTALVSLAGPASNLILATITSIIYFLLSQNSVALDVYADLAVIIIKTNVVLAVFNLIPVHPLDGGKILVGILPPEQARQVDRFMNQYGIFLLMVLIFPVFGTAPISAIIDPIVSFLLRIYLPTLHLVRV